MLSSTPATIFFGLATSLLLVGCGGQQRLRYAEQSCAPNGSLYVVSLESGAVKAEQRAVLANTDSVNIVDRTNVLLTPSRRSLIFGSKMMSYHGFGPTPQSVAYKDLSGMTYEADDSTLTINHTVVGWDDGNRGMEEERLRGISAGCYDDILAFMHEQSGDS